MPLLGNYPVTLEEASRARQNPLVREAWACALRAGVSPSELRSQSILKDSRGQLPGLEATAKLAPQG